MEFLKKYWKQILGLVVYTILVVFISITSYKSYLSNQLNSAIEDAFSNVFNNSDEKNTNDDSKTNNEEQIIETRQININETITTQDWEITLNGTEFLQDVVPPTPNMFYSHYQVKDTTNTYLVVKLNMKNISTISLQADDNISIKAIYDEQYEYTGFSTLLAQDNSDFDYTNITSIAPLTSRTLYYLIEMPKDITVDDKDIEIQLNAYQDKYLYKVPKIQTKSDTSSNNVDTEEIPNTNVTPATTKNNTSKIPENNTIKKDTDEVTNPYEENVVYFYDAANSNNSQNGNSLDAYINNNISNIPVPELPSNAGLNADYIIEGSGF